MSRRLLQSLLVLPVLVACGPDDGPRTFPEEEAATESAASRDARPAHVEPRAALPFRPALEGLGALPGLPLERPLLTMPRDHDGDGIPAEADCDDTDPRIYPGAAESCDGVDRNCDGHAFAPASVHFLHADGTLEDRTADFDGTAESPAHLVLDEPGALVVCETTLHATLEVDADVAIHAMGRAFTTAIDGGGAGPVVEVVGEGHRVFVNRVALTGGDAERGGGLSCVGDHEVFLWEAALVDNQADEGGGLYAEGCTVRGLRAHIRANRAAESGGGIALRGGALQLQDSLVIDNHSDAQGGGIAVEGWGGAASVELVDTFVVQNDSAEHGGGIALQTASKHGASVELACSDAHSGGMLGNTAPAGEHLSISRAGAGETDFWMGSCIMGTAEERSQIVLRDGESSDHYSGLVGGAVECDDRACR